MCLLPCADCPFLRGSSSEYVGDDRLAFWNEHMVWPTYKAWNCPEDGTQCAGQIQYWANACVGRMIEDYDVELAQLVFAQPIDRVNFYWGNAEFLFRERYDKLPGMVLEQRGVQGVFDF